MNRAPAVAELGGKRLGLVDGRLGSLELLPLLDYCTRFGEPRLQSLGMWLRDDRRRRAARQGSVGSGTGNHGATDQEGEPALHEADATVSPATCLATRRIVPEPHAEELKARLAESRAVVDEREEFEAAETPIDQAEPLPSGLGDRRSSVHERGRQAAEEMRRGSTSD